ncbi:hypothetical protein H8356DRAFT_1705112 [Neocallimastix lanati (nom. inval.)]|nr:hypothetical protein H8356DRAFT_1705112 [Neocallimastix sp. JGI-2020a]
MPHKVDNLHFHFYHSKLMSYFFDWHIRLIILQFLNYFYSMPIKLDNLPTYIFHSQLIYIYFFLISVTY